MKRLFALIVVIGFLMGCAGISANAPISAAIDTGFYFALKNNPQYKPTLVQGLTGVKTFLAGSVTYDQLLVEIAKQFPANPDTTNIINIIRIDLLALMSTDKPISSSWFPMTDAYKQAVTVQIDKYLLIASMVP